MRPSGSRCDIAMHALLTHLTLIHTIFLFLNAQVLELGRTDEKELSTVLLLTPHFSLHSPGGYDLLADTLNGALTNLKAEEIIQLVFFHPGYAFRDGQDRTGGGSRRKLRAALTLPDD